MRHIRMRQQFDCEAAVAAMVCGADYRAALTAALACGFDPSWGMLLRDFHRLLETLSGRPWRVVAPARKPLGEYGRLPAEPCAVLIRKVGDRLGHWIATESGAVFDGAREKPVLMPRYRLKHWLLIRYVVAVA